MSIQSNIFCWHGISTDLELGKAFYTGVLGWNVPPDGEGPPVFVAPGGAVAHLQAPDKGPPSWCSYLSVSDVDASTALAVDQGGVAVVPPTDLPSGRFSVVATPTGASFGLFQATEQDELAKDGAGSIHWVELHSTSAVEDVAWLESVFGFSSKVREMAAGRYHVLEIDGVPRGGVMASSSEVSSFVAWVAVDDLDATLAKVGPHGGKAVNGPFADPAVGRMAIVADPSGATFGLIQPA